MEILQSIKNYIGDCLGYIRCPITRDTLWRENLVRVPYTEHQKLIISRKGLISLKKEELARQVFEKANEGLGYPESFRLYHGKRLSIEEIAERIPNQ